MFIRGVEHFQHDSSVTFNGHTQCLTGFTQVILEPQPQRVVMRVGTLGQNGANRPQFIDTTVAEIPRYITGMGMPSISIYARELIVDYGVKKLIRVGTAGSLNEDVHVRELVLAQAAATNSNIIRNDWPQYDFPQIASFDLLDKAYHIAKDLGMTTHVGNVLSSDVFYSNYFEKNIELGKWGVKAVEMEAAALYYLAAQHQVDALAIMTISDSLVNPDEDTTAEERQNTFTDMMKVGLETLIAD